MTKVGTAVLVFGALLGARAVAREIAMPLDELDRLVQQRRIASLEPRAGKFLDQEPDWVEARQTANRPEARFVPQHNLVSGSPYVEASRAADRLDEDSVATFQAGFVQYTFIVTDPHGDVWAQWKEQAILALPEALRINSEHRDSIDAIHALATSGASEAGSIVTGGPALDAADMLEEDLLACFPFTGADGSNAMWKKWRDEAIGALPVELRNDSEYRKSIDEVFHRAVGRLNEFSVDIINRPPVGGYDIGGIGFTDIYEVAEETPAAPDPPKKDEKLWIAHCDEWLNRAIDGLPNDPNYLRPAVTTYGELVALGAPAPSEEDLQWRLVAIEAMLSRRK